MEGDDITAMMDEVSEAHFYLKTARNVVANYREFCKRVHKFAGWGTAEVCKSVYVVHSRSVDGCSLC